MDVDIATRRPSCPCPFCASLQFIAMWDPICGNYHICRECHGRLLPNGNDFLTIEKTAVHLDQIGVIVNNIVQENSVLKQRIDALHDELTKVKTLLNQVYYAPGMPGFVYANHSFYTQNT